MPRSVPAAPPRVRLPASPGRFRLRDSAIVEASRVMGCPEVLPEVLSEDLGNGQEYSGVKGVNPVPVTGVPLRAAPGDAKSGAA